MNGIGWAVKQLQDGKRVQRAGWNGNGMWLTLAKDWVALFTDDAKGLAEADAVLSREWRGNLPFVAMFTADKALVPWLCSQTDLLAIDWQIVEAA